MKRKTEILIVVAQNRSIRTTLVKLKIDRNQEDSLCRLCKQADESIDHAVSGCINLAQEKYKRRHDNLGKIAQWKLVNKCNFEAEVV